VAAGGRVPRDGEKLPDLIPLDAKEFKLAMTKIAGS
jgi:hypothetical protein